MLRPSKASMLGLQSPSRLRGICELPQPPQLLHHRAHISPFLRASQHLHNAAASPQPPKALSSSAAASLPPPSLQEDVAVSQALRRSRAAFVCLAAIAAWTYMASSNCPSAPLASVSLAAGETSMQGASTAVKSAWAGLAAGFLHTLCGPDHLAALTPLTIGRGRVAASALGAIWGFGHSTGQLILGLVFVLLKERFHDFVPFLSRWAGTVVGCTLLAIGGMGIYESWVEPAVEARGQGHASSSSSGGSMDGGDEAPAVGTLALEGGVAAPASSDAKDAGWLGLRWMRTVMRRGLGTYATGIVYGLQPDALFVVIPALALPTKLAAVAYCTMFVLGTVTAMGGYTLVIGTTSSALTRDKPWLQAHLSTIASGVAITVGLLVLAASFGVTIPGVPMLGGGG